MKKMTEREACTLIDYMVKNSVTESGQIESKAEKYLKYYMAEKFGDEVPGRSQVVSTDTRDLVEADMPSLARVFLGAGDPVEFKPIGTTQEAIQEARDKQAVVGHIIRTCKNSFRTQHDWLKTSEIAPIAAIEYGVEEVIESRCKRFDNVTEDELAATIVDIESDADVQDVDIETEDNEDGTINADLNIKVAKIKYFMRNVPFEDMIISRNAQNKEDAEIIGKVFRKRRGELVAEGFPKELVESLPTRGGDETDRDTLKAIRYDRQGGQDYDDSNYIQWANQEVEGVDAYVLMDYDGDGVAERRHIIKVGKVVLENEPFDHVPYAIISSMLMPNNIMGIPRAELTEQYQRINSVLWRQTLDNMYQVNMPRWAYTDNVDIDSLLDHQFGGAVHVEGMPGNELMPMQTPYVGDKSLQVIQYMEGKKQASTGNMIANQALEADQLQNETATRFNGMEDANKAKIELVARVIAEIGYRDLWEGFAWFAAHYQNTELEVRVLGREMMVNPKDWKHDSYICAKVGTGAGDNEQIVQDLSVLYQTQSALLQMGSPLVDNVKIYNTLANITQALGKDAVSEFFNNPEEPESMVTAERDMLRNMVNQVQMENEQLKGNANMLVQAEQAKNEGRMNEQLMKQKYDAQVKMMDLQADFDKRLSEALQKRDQQMRELQYKYDQLAVQTRFDYDKLETEQNTDIKGEGTDDRSGQDKPSEVRRGTEE